MAEEGTQNAQWWQKAPKPKSLLWKLATDCTRFDWRIWICKAQRAQLVVWNSFSARTTESPCGHVVDERRLRSKRRRNRRGNKGKRGIVHSWMFLLYIIFACRCVTSLSELLSHICQCEGVSASPVLTWWFKMVIYSHCSSDKPVSGGVWWWSWRPCLGVYFLVCVSCFVFALYPPCDCLPLPWLLWPNPY